MSSSILSNNNCGPVTGLLSNQTFLLHAQTPQKTISPPPLWRTFYAPPAPPLPPPPQQTSTLQALTISNININDDQSAERGSPLPLPTRTSAAAAAHQQQTARLLNLKTPTLQNNNSINVNLPNNQRMTLQKLPSSNAEQTTQGAHSSSTQKSIMSVSKLVRPTPKSQHPHQQQQHLSLHHQQPHVHQQHHYINDIQTGPINLVTSNSSSAEQAGSRSRPSSNSSVDIESDDIPTTPTQPHQLQHHHHHQQQQQHSPNLVAVSASLTNPAAYPFNYSHLYVNKPGYHNALHAPPYTSYAAMAAAIAASTPNNNIYPINTALSHHQSLALAPPPSPLPVSTATGTIAVPSNISPSSIEHRQQHHQHQQHLQDAKSRLNSSSDRMFSPPLSVIGQPTNASLSNGTYLNCKTSPASDSADSSTENYFKVPNVSSGKEGSLKHRILTRPAALLEKEEKTSKSAVISTHKSTANFKKGSYIELANGVLRRVEDMRTEDFIQCAERSVHLQLAESTVVRIDTTKPQMVIITFSYDRNRSKAEIEVSVDHPFFVYGQGWASCDPEKSHKAFGLKCQRLQVGDICISLTQRTTPAVAIKTEAITKEESLRYVKAEMAALAPTATATVVDSGLPLTLAIKNELQVVMPPPPPTMQHNTNNAGNAAIYTRPPPPPPPPTHYMPCHLPAAALPTHHQIPYPDFAELVAAAAAYNSSAAHLHHMQAAMPPPPSPDAINGFYQQTQQLYLQGKVTAADLRLQPPTAVSPAQAQQASQSYCSPRTALLPPPPPPPTTAAQHLSPLMEHTQDQPFDASIASRKRRWSAPEGDCDGAEGSRDHCQNPKLYKTAMAPVTT